MASQAKVRWSQLRVGLMALVALAILGYLIILMTGSKGFFESTTEIYTFMDDAAAVADGAPVTLNGIPIGKVRHAELSGLNEPNRVIRIAMLINDEYLSAIPEDSEAQITAANLLGTKFVNVKKGKSAQPIKAGGELHSLDTREIDDIVQQGYTTMAALNGIVKRVDDVLAQVEVGKGTIGKLLVDETLYKKILDIANEGQKLVVTMNTAEGTLGKLLREDDLYKDMRGTIARVDTLVDGINRGEGTAGKLLKDTAVYDETRMAIQDLRRLLAGLEKGEGTAGKLLKSDELHNQIRATMGRVDTMLDKINSGEGTLGQLMVNPALYESLDGTTREIQGLMRDFRANPKKFLTIQLKLF